MDEGVQAIFDANLPEDRNPDVHLMTGPIRVDGARTSDVLKVALPADDAAPALRLQPRRRTAPSVQQVRREGARDDLPHRRMPTATHSTDNTSTPNTSWSSAASADPSSSAGSQYNTKRQHETTSPLSHSPQQSSDSDWHPHSLGFGTTPACRVAHRSILWPCRAHWLYPAKLPKS